MTGVATVEAFLNEKETLFNRFYDALAVLEERVEANAVAEGANPTEGVEAAREELEKIRDTFRTKAKATWDTVMSQEITLVTQTEQVLKLCEQSLDAMIANFLNKVRCLFQVGGPLYSVISQQNETKNKISLFVASMEETLISDIFDV